MIADIKCFNRVDATLLASVTLPRKLCPSLKTRSSTFRHHHASAGICHQENKLVSTLSSKSCSVICLIEAAKIELFIHVAQKGKEAGLRTTYYPTLSLKRLSRFGKS